MSVFLRLPFALRIATLFALVLAGSLLSGTLAVRYFGDPYVFMGGFILGMFATAALLIISAMGWLQWYKHQPTQPESPA